MCMMENVMSKEELLHIAVQSGSQSGEWDHKMMTAFAWIRCLLNGNSPLKQLRTKGIDEIIVYGIAELGNLLVYEALKEEYKIIGVTDKKIIAGQYDFESIPILSRQELCAYKDKCIVVTAVGFWKEIYRELDQIGCSNVIALWELL